MSSGDYEAAIKLLRGMARRRSNMPASWGSVDVAQAVALKVIRADRPSVLAQPQSPAHRGYLSRTLHSVIGQYWRDRYRRRAAEDGATEDWSEETSEQPDGALFVLETIAELIDRTGKHHSDPKRLERVFDLYFVQGWTFRDIAAEVSAPTTAVWRDVQLAKRFMRKRLEQHGFDVATFED